MHWHCRWTSFLMSSWPCQCHSRTIPFSPFPADCFSHFGVLIVCIYSHLSFFLRLSSFWNIVHGSSYAQSTFFVAILPYAKTPWMAGICPPRIIYFYSVQCVHRGTTNLMVEGWVPLRVCSTIKLRATCLFPAICLGCVELAPVDAVNLSLFFVPPAHMTLSSVATHHRFSGRTVTPTKRNMSKYTRVIIQSRTPQTE